MYLKSIFLLTIFLLGVSGCGHDDLTASPLKIEFCLAPGISPQPNITSIELTVTAPDMAPQLFPISDINREQRTARGSIQLPAGIKAAFVAKAFEGECPVLRGSLDNVEIKPDHSPITIKLDPVQIVIAIRSEQEQLKVGDSYILGVYVEDAPRLSAFTCELEFDESLLEPLEIVPGGFFGGKDDFLFIEDSQLPRRQVDRIALGITRKSGEDGVCGSGIVFRLTFRTIGTGNTTIKLLNNEMFKLLAANFEEIEDPSRIRIEANASVKIE